MESTCRFTVEAGGLCVGKPGGPAEIPRSAISPLEISYTNPVLVGDQTRENADTSPGARTMDENRLERSTRVVVSPLLMSSGATAALLFKVESIPVLGGPD